MVTWRKRFFSRNMIIKNIFFKKHLRLKTGTQSLLYKDDGLEKVYEGLHKSMIECLMYLTTTSPSKTHDVSLLSRYMHCASEIHLQAAKHNFFFHGFFDSNQARCADDMRSTLGYRFSFDSGVFLRYSKKKDVVAQSTIEAEYVVVVATINQALWLRKLLTYLDMKQEVSIEVFVDNQVSISITNYLVFMEKNKSFQNKIIFSDEGSKQRKTTISLLQN
ncbi:Copia protein [Gossypium australe]|uniref:Copia protein n=1 Tax=Gossypium australe TaxID=47621 RepID=A0A5B6UZS3_9ROSI|nr:Copia protein [Gossypium australe]